MSAKLLVLHPPPITAKDSTGVELRFRDEYSDEWLSACELEALAPVLPELVGELLAIMSLEHE